MKQFETFGEYMFDLLFAPLKKGRKTVNQLRIFFKVMGREFDDLKAAIFRVRSEANVASCSEVMLPVHGQDRDMPRLEGEDAEAYRTRLSMKGIISQWSGTRRGVLYALTALGYDRSRIELFAEQDAERWAEFIIFLNSSKPSGVTNLSVIDAQVRKVKEGSSKPAYGMETIGGLIIRSQLQTGFSRYPRCGEIVCGVWPHIVSEGRLVVSTVMAQGGASGGDNPFPRAGTFAASEEFYHFGTYTIYQGFASDIEAGSLFNPGFRQASHAIQGAERSCAACGRISSVKDISWPRRSWRKAAHRAAAIPSREPAHLQPPRSSITSARTPFIRASPRTLRRARRRRRVQRST